MDNSAEDVPYVPEGPFTVLIGCDDPSIAAQIGYTPPYSNSRQLYGDLADIVSEPSVITSAAAIQIAHSYFSTHASPDYRPTITINSDPTVYLPGDLFQLAGPDGPLLMPLKQNSVDVTLTWNGIFKTQIDLQREQEDMVGIVQQIVQDTLRTLGPNGQGAGGSAGYLSNAGGQGVTNVTPAYRTSLQASSTDTTLHDAYTGVPHSSQASQDTWSATTAEVVQARTLSNTGQSYASLQAAMAAITGSGSGGSSSGGAQVLISPPPYWRMQYKFDSLNRIPTASDFAGLETYTYMANGMDGSLRFETPGLTLDAYWKIGIKNTTGATVSFSWSLPYVDNYAAGSQDGTQFFSVSSSGPGSSGTLSVAAGTVSYLSLFYANTSSQVYDTANQGTFWFFMDALLQPGLVFVDSTTGLSPGVAAIGDATTTTTGVVEVHQNAASGAHPVVYLSSEVDALISTESSARSTEDTALLNDINAESTARQNADALALQKSSNLSDLASASTARTNLGLGTAAVLNAPTNGNNASAAQTVLGNDTRLAAAATAVQKRRCSVQLAPNSTTADTGPNLTQIRRLPPTSTAWLPLTADMHVDVPASGSTTLQVYYSTGSPFGAGTAVLSTPLTVSGIGNYDSPQRTSFTGSLATAGLPSRAFITSAFTALAGSDVSGVLELIEL